MTGTVVNTLCIVAGVVLGTLMKRAISGRYTQTLYNAMGLAALMLGANTFVQNMPKSEVPVLSVVSMALGGLVGAWLDLQGRVDRFGERKGVSRLVQGLTVSTLLYCIGTFSIVGPMLAALKGDNTFLYTNATLDLVTSTVFGATYGIGMIMSAVILFVWQGSIYLMARLSAESALFQEQLLNEMCIVGGMLIVSSGLSILGIKDCKTLNFLPALLVPAAYYLLF